MSEPANSRDDTAGASVCDSAPFGVDLPSAPLPEASAEVGVSCRRVASVRCVRVVQKMRGKTLGGKIRRAEGRCEGTLVPGFYTIYI